MFNLFKTELLRHQAHAFGLMLLHFSILYYLYSRGISILQSMQALVWLLICMVLAAGFGIFQMTRYSRDNDWIYLLQRPLPLPRIFLALTLAGVCISLFIAVLPLVLYLALMDANPMFGVEGRHYQSIPYATAAAFAAYCCGCFAVLSTSRLGLLALGILMVFVVVEPGTDLLFSSLLLMLWSLLLARVAFKPDRSQPPRGVWTLLLTELPIQCGCLLLITAVTAWLASADDYLHGINRFTNPKPGSDDFVRALPEKDAMQFALQHSTHAEARQLGQQVLLGEFMSVGPASFNRYPVRGQLKFIDEALTLADGSEQQVWRFRHDVMLFEGRENGSERFAGWLAPDGIHGADAPLPAARFDSVPWGTANQYIISDNDIFQVTWDDRKVHHRYHSNDSDRFNNSLTLGEDTATLFSDSKLYFFASDELRNPDSTLAPRAILEVPDTTSPDLRKLALLPLRDCYLVSALLDPTPYSNAPAFASLGHGRVELYRVRGSTKELIASTALPSGTGDWALYKDLVLAPGIRLFNDFVAGLRTRASAQATVPLWHVQLPFGIRVATGFVCLLSAALTAWMLRRSTLPPRLKTFWIVGNGLTGCAGLLSFFLGYYWKRGDLLLAIATPAPPTMTTTEAGKLGYSN